MTTYIVENRHDAEQCDAAFDALERAATESDARVRDDTLLCTCPHDRHGGTVIVEAEADAAAEAFAARFDVGDTTVNQISEMRIGGE